MTLTAEENELLTRVGPGTPMGALLRCYWYPIAATPELTDGAPTRFVRLLGEDLVLYKDRCGQVGLLADHCSHRGASLLYGRVEERGIACAYHGWLYDAAGYCLETPAEPPGSSFHLTVRHTAYPVREMCGLYWAYLGPPPAPEIPRYDVWARIDGQIQVAVYPRLDANWLQVMENTVDPSHATILHQEFMARGRPVNTTRGLIDEELRFDFYEVPYGIIKVRTFANGFEERHPLIFPNILRESNVAQVRVPMDDTHTNFFFIYFIPQQSDVDGRSGINPEVHYVPPFKEPADRIHPNTRFKWDNIMAQDFTTWETQGPIFDRTRERLATSDRIIVYFREMLRREIERVQRGEDPLAVVRDPDHSIIDTFLDQALQKRWYTPGQYSSQRAGAQRLSGDDAAARGFFF
ncbi:MAG: Rieske (2Fe-2S) iron-sulfur domain protein [Chloroflexi bacterium]|nr:Rieske (2Fe-2S) iron-sulfur domain protein [Chloroflexota bacterium]